MCNWYGLTFSNVNSGARIIAEQVGKVQLQPNAEKQKRQTLEAKVESLENDVKRLTSTVQELLDRWPNPCDCQQTMLNAFGAAMSTISNSHVSNEPPLRQVFEPMQVSTPVLSTKTTHPDHKAAEKCKIRLNPLGRTIVPSQPSLVLRLDITSKKGFYRSDGVLLNVLGLEFYLDSLKNVLEMAIAKQSVFTKLVYKHCTNKHSQ